MAQGPEPTQELLTRRFADLAAPGAAAPTLLVQPVGPYRDELPFYFLASDGADPLGQVPAAELAALRRADGFLVLDNGGEAFRLTPRIARALIAARRRHRLANRIVLLSQNSAQPRFEDASLTAELSRHVTFGFNHSYGLDLLDRLAPRADELIAGAEAAPADPPHDVLCLNFAARPHRLIALMAIKSDPRLSCVTTLGDFSKTPGMDPAAVLRAAERSPMFARLRDRFFPDGLDADLLARGNRRELRREETDPLALAAMVEPQDSAATRFSLVTETEMSRGEIRRFTEKSMKPAALGHPFLILGNPGALAELTATFGLASFPDLFDESYDGFAEPARRMACALRSVREIARTPKEARAALFAPARARALANQRMILREGRRRLEDRIIDGLAAALRAARDRTAAAEG